MTDREPFDDLTLYDQHALRLRVHTEPHPSPGIRSLTTFTIGETDGQVTSVEIADQRIYDLAVNLLQRVQWSMPFDRLAAALALLESVAS